MPRPLKVGVQMPEVEYAAALGRHPGDGAPRGGRSASTRSGSVTTTSIGPATARADPGRPGRSSRRSRRSPSASRSARSSRRSASTRRSSWRGWPRRSTRSAAAASSSVSAPAGTRPSTARSGSRSTISSRASRRRSRSSARSCGRARSTSTAATTSPGTPSCSRAGRGPADRRSSSARADRGCCASTLPHVDAWNAWYTTYGNRPSGVAAQRALVDEACQRGRTRPGRGRTHACRVRADAWSDRLSGTSTASPRRRSKGRPTSSPRPSPPSRARASGTSSSSSTQSRRRASSRSLRSSRPSSLDRPG